MDDKNINEIYIKLIHIINKLKRSDIPITYDNIKFYFEKKYLNIEKWSVIVKLLNNKKIYIHSLYN